MGNKLETLEEIDSRIMELIELMRLMYPNFNDIPFAGMVVESLFAAYRANGKLADAIDKGWVE